MARRRPRAASTCSAAADDQSLLECRSRTSCPIPVGRRQRGGREDGREARGLRWPETCGAPAQEAPASASAPSGTGERRPLRVRQRARWRLARAWAAATGGASKRRGRAKREGEIWKPALAPAAPMQSLKHRPLNGVEAFQAEIWSIDFHRCSFLWTILWVQKDGAPNRGQMCWVAVGKKNFVL